MLINGGFNFKNAGRNLLINEFAGGLDPKIVLPEESNAPPIERTLPGWVAPNIIPCRKAEVNSIINAPRPATLREYSGVVST